MTNCPNRKQLELLLTNGFTETVREELELHVEDCAACQQKLEALTNATLWDLEPRDDGIPVPVNGKEPGVLVDPLKVTPDAMATADAPTGRGEPMVAGYEILGELGRGGMGVVYKARNVRLKRPCALKMILAGAHAAPAEVARFLAEAEAIARLQHSHIVQIRHIGEAEGLPFFELEYVSGGSLDQQLDGTPWPAIRAARLAEQVALGIAEAHRLGIVHRDLKPANVLLTAEGTPKVSDFGLAKMLDSQAGLTRSEAVMGSPSYMAPEQAQGRAKEAGPAVDVYAVGAILYELLTGRPPFRGPTALETLEQVKTTEPVSPSQLVPGLPHDIETICLKCLQKDPAKRYATAWALVEDLRRFQDGRPILARRIGGAERAWRWCRRNPTVAGLTALAAALTVSITIVSTVAAWTYKASLSRAEKAEHQARLALGKSLVSEGAALQRTGLIGQRFESLDRLTRAAQVLGADPEGRKQLPEIRNQAIAALGLTDLRVRRPHDYGDVLEVNVDAALERYAVVEHSGVVVVRRLDDDRELVRLLGPDRRDFWYAYPNFSPDGKLLAAIYVLGQRGGDLLRVWHLERRELLVSLPKLSGPVIFHPDGRHVLFGALEGGIGVWDRVERRVVRRLPLDFTPWSLALDPEGWRLAVSNADAASPRVAIVELETGRLLEDWRSQVGNSALGWSADGQLLATGTGEGDGRVYVWNVRRRALASVLRGHLMILSAQFAHSGYLLATTSWDGTTRLWDAASGEPLAMASGKLQGSFAPDDGRLAFAVGGKLGVWDVAVAPECRTLHPGMLGNRSEARDATVVMAADVSPDGSLMATGDKDGVRLWELDTGRELAHLEAGLCETVLFHPDGQRLISSSRWGLYAWPIRPDPDHGLDAIRVGPPELLRESAGTEWGVAAWMPDHRTLALIDNANAQVLLVDSSHPHPAWSRATALDSGANRRMTSVAVSPDGRWLAAGGWKEAGVRVWDLRRHRLERILRPKDAVGATIFFIGFSPDGRWLVSSTSPDSSPIAYHFWRLGTWDLALCIDQERGGRATNSPAFTSDGRLMALGIAPDQVLLADPATGRELARLTTLQPVTPTPLVFSLDDTKLMARTNQKTVLVWDLRRIREKLAPIGLDWDAPPYPTAPDSHDAPGPIAPPRPVRNVGEVVEPTARRAQELVEMNRRLAANLDDAEALIHRGWLFTQRKMWPEAIADLEQLLRLRPGDPDACWLLGETYEEADKLPSALGVYSRLLERAPEDHEARFRRGLVALAFARPGLAADDFSRVLASEPDLDRVRYRRAQALIRLGRHREALADLDTLIPNDPNNDALYDLRGIVREALGDHERSRADREKARSLLPKDPETLNARAWIAATGPFSRRDPEQAVAWARRAIALAPGAQMYLNTLGVALYHAGQYAEAISVLEQSLAAGKGEIDGFDLFFLAMAHQKLGHASQARACFDQAVRWGEQTKLSPGYFRELRGIHAEAEAVLAGSADDLPADVFAKPR